MKFYEFKLNSDHAHINEAKMSPGKFQKFLSGAGKDMVAGFEAELIFPNYSLTRYDAEQDFEQKSKRKIVGFNELGEFLAQYMPADKASKAVKTFEFNMYNEIGVNILDQNINKLLKEPASKENFVKNINTAFKLANKPINVNSVDGLLHHISKMDGGVSGFAPIVSDVMNSISANNDNNDIVKSLVILDTALKEIIYLVAISLNHMSLSDAIARIEKHDPSFTINLEKNDRDNVKHYTELIDDFIQKTQGYGYDTVDLIPLDGSDHSERNDIWKFTRDASIRMYNTENTIGIEIVSPAMPLPKTIEVLDKFFSWVSGNSGYAVSETGFHMSVSVKDHDFSKLDYTKMALFLGDNYVLSQFDRVYNVYTVPAVKYIIEQIKEQVSERNVGVITDFFNKIKNKTDDAIKDLFSPSRGFGKYASINPKLQYIEIRSAGNTDYFKDIPKLQNMLLRYAYAAYVAMNPDILKQEYRKKLYSMFYKNAGATDKLHRDRDQLLTALETIATAYATNSNENSQYFRTAIKTLLANDTVTTLNANVTLTWADGTDKRTVIIPLNKRISGGEYLKVKRLFGNEVNPNDVPTTIADGIMVEIMMLDLSGDESVENAPNRFSEFETVLIEPKRNTK